MISKLKEGLTDLIKVYHLSGTSKDDRSQYAPIPNGSTFYGTDTGKTYFYDAENDAWNEVDMGGGGGSGISPAEKGAANGVAPLNASSKIDSTYLPSYVDDVVEYNTRDDFPLTGESDKIYVAKDTNKTYRWSGSDYVQVGGMDSATKKYVDDTLASGLETKQDTLIAGDNITIENNVISASIGGPEPEIPIAYRILEYAQSDGAAWIDTGVTINGVYTLKEELSVPRGKSCAAMVAHYDQDMRQGFMVFNKSSHKIARFWPSVDYTDVPVDSNINLGNKFSVVQNNSSITVAQDSYSTTATYKGGTGTDTKTIHLLHSDNPNHESCMNGTLYSAQILNGSDYVLNMVPVQRKSDNIVGMFDKVSKTFFDSDGTGVFLAGPIADENTGEPDLSTKMDKTNPTGTGMFSLNRKAGSEAGDYSFAEGVDTTASGKYSHAEGYRTTASGNHSHVEGAGAIASGFSSHAEGHYATASGNCSHAEGLATIAAGDFQHVSGKNNVEDSAGEYAIIVGNGSKSGERSNAFAMKWDGTFVLPDADSADKKLEITPAEFKAMKNGGGGSSLIRQGVDDDGNPVEGATIIGYENNTASGVNSHAEGSGATASGRYSHSEGSSTTASGEGSHAEGQGTIAARDYQHVSGKYNIEDTNGEYLVIVGNGTDDTSRSNAVAIKNDGSLVLAGGVTFTPSDLQALYNLIHPTT